VGTKVMVLWLASLPLLGRAQILTWEPVSWFSSVVQVKCHDNTVKYSAVATNMFSHSHPVKFSILLTHVWRQGCCSFYKIATDNCFLTYSIFCLS
jgi:hypothetical protein